MEIVRYQRKHPAHGWIEVEEDNLEFYSKQGQAIRPLYAPSARNVSAELPELAARCKEILAWRKTGLLEGNALREYAAREFDHLDIDPGETLKLAEEATLMQAADFITD